MKWAIIYLLNVINSFIFVFADEEGIIEETDKHKNHYFPSKNQNKPTNFLFSNEDDIDDDETWNVAYFGLFIKRNSVKIFHVNT